MTNPTIPDEAVEAAWAAYCLELYPGGKDFPSAIRAALAAALPFLLAQARREERERAADIAHAWITDTGNPCMGACLGLSAYLRSLPDSNETKEG